LDDIGVWWIQGGLSVVGCFEQRIPPLRYGMEIQTQVPFGNDKQREKAPSVVSRKFVEEITAGPSTSFAKKTANCAQDDNFIYVRIDDNFIYVRINDSGH